MNEGHLQDVQTQTIETSLESLSSLSLLPVAAYLADASGHLLKWNRDFADLVGTDPTSGVLVSSLLTSRHLKFESKPLFSSDGQLLGSLNLLVPIEESVEELKQELFEARESSAKAASIKTNFLCNMSHELRTPLNAILGMGEALYETDLSSEQRKLLSVLNDAGRNLLTLINDILEFSRLESGQLPLQVEPFVLHKAVRAVFQRFEPIALQRGLTLHLDIAASPELRVSGDAKKLDQVLSNLLDNALKFTPHGQVILKVEPKDQSTNMSEWLFTVSDTGIGIPGDRMNELFQSFTQADPSTTRKYGGTGLGLAICKQLVGLMGGSIWVESTLGEGTHFSFSVKFAAAESTQPERVLPNRELPVSIDSALDGLKILVVEDSRDNAFLLMTYLKRLHCRLDFAENGREAVEKFEKGQYDLILMDMQMPEMDGYAATRWIRILEKRRQKRIPIIALTAFVFEDQVRKSFEAGCDLHVNKPVTRKELLNAIASVIGSEDE